MENNFIDLFFMLAFGSTTGFWISLSRLFERSGFFIIRSLLFALFMVKFEITRDDAILWLGHFSVTYFGFGFVAGLLSDQIKRRRIIILLGGIIQSVSPLLFLSDNKQLVATGLLLFAVGSGLYTSMSLTGFLGTFYDKPKKLFRGILANGIAVNIGLICGSWLVMKYMEDLLSMQNLIVVSPIFFFTALIINYFFFPKEPDKTAQGDHPAKDQKKGNLLFLVVLIVSLITWTFYDAFERPFENMSAFSEFEPLDIYLINTIIVCTLSLILIISRLFRYLKVVWSVALSLMFFAGIFVAFLAWHGTDIFVNIETALITQFLLLSFVEVFLQTAFFATSVRSIPSKNLATILGFGGVAISVSRVYVAPLIAGDDGSNLNEDLAIGIIVGALILAVSVILLRSLFKDEPMHTPSIGSEPDEIQLKQGDLLD